MFTIVSPWCINLTKNRMFTIRYALICRRQNSKRLRKVYGSLTAQTISQRICWICYKVIALINQFCSILPTIEWCGWEKKQMPYRNVSLLSWNGGLINKCLAEAIMCSNYLQDRLITSLGLKDRKIKNLLSVILNFIVLKFTC